MKKGKMIYEGKAKKVFQTDDPNLYIQYFKDDATAFDATKRGTIGGKGVVNNKISATIFMLLEKKGIKTHFVKLLSDREMLMKRLEILPGFFLHRQEWVGLPKQPLYAEPFCHIDHCIQPPFMAQGKSCTHCQSVSRSRPRNESPIDFLRSNAGRKLICFNTQKASQDLL